MVAVPDDRTLLLQLERAQEVLEDKIGHLLDDDFAQALRSDLYDSLSDALEDYTSDLDKRVEKLENTFKVLAQAQQEILALLIELAELVKNG